MTDNGPFDDDPRLHIWCGPDHDRLYRQGTCIMCKIPLFGESPKPRALCGLCRADQLREALASDG